MHIYRWFKSFAKRIPSIDRLVKERNDYYKALEIQQSTLNEKEGIIETLLLKLQEIDKEASVLNTQLSTLAYSNNELKSEINRANIEINTLKMKEIDLLVAKKKIEEDYYKLKQLFEEFKSNSLRRDYYYKNTSFDSSKFWDDHYKQGKNSGTGSYSHLAEFKAEIINNFLLEKHIDRTIELGCGDGNQLSMINYKEYVGIDVSETIINLNKEKFSSDVSKQFYTINEINVFSQQKYDLALSLDVIFHLNEDEVYHNYMDILFNISNKYVIIYSSNHEEFTAWPEFRNRKFMKIVQEKYSTEWKLIDFIPNRYPFELGNEEKTSPSDFYIFKKIKRIGGRDG